MSLTRYEWSGSWYVCLCVCVCFWTCRNHLPINSLLWVSQPKLFSCFGKGQVVDGDLKTDLIGGGKREVLNTRAMATCEYMGDLLECLHKNCLVWA